MKPNCKLPIPFLKCQRIDVFQYHCQASPITMSGLEQWCKICFLNKIYASTTLCLGREKKKGNIRDGYIWRINLTFLTAFAVAFLVLLVVPLQKYKSRWQTFLFFLNLFPGQAADSSPAPPSVLGESKQPQPAAAAQQEHKKSRKDQASAGQKSARAQEGRIPSCRVL